MKKVVLCAALGLLSGCSSTEAGGQSITITTVVPPATDTKGGKTSATWAAQRKGTTWVPITPTAEGTYVLRAEGDRWAAAFVCADQDDALVVVHEEPITTRTFEVTLASSCAKTGPEVVGTLAGALANPPAEAGWLDFGYALEARGVALPDAIRVYEEVNVAAGTWDLIYGIRPSAPLPHSRIALLRNQTLAGDSAKVDVDLGTAITPGKQKLAIHGMDFAIDTSVNAPVLYTLQGGKVGIDLGPQSVPQDANAALEYSTIPAPSQAPADRYRLELHAGADTEGHDDVALRGVTATFHDAVDLDVTLVPSLGPPVLTNVVQDPVVVEAKSPARANVASYEMKLLGKISNRQQREWRITMNAMLVSGEVVLRMPELGGVAGFDKGWGLPTNDRREVTVTAKQVASPLSDGTIEHWAGHFHVMRPRE